jgi:biopolymer transport protein ExbB
MITLSIIVVGISALKVRELFFTLKRNQKVVGRGVLAQIKAGTLASTSKELRGSDPIFALTKAALQVQEKGFGAKEIEKQMDLVLEAFSKRCEKGINFLSITANVATGLGLIYTVMGMINSFKAVELASAELKQQILSDSMGIAIHSTYLGVIIALPALIMYALLNNRADLLKEDLNKAALKVYIVLGSLKSQQQK